MKKILQNTLCGMTAATLALAPFNVYAMSQDETVYAKLQADGTQSYISVTKHLLNDAGNSELLDKTTLKNIENINGFEAYTINNDQLTWAANGKDIYYTGETTQELPVRVEVSYKLDGVEKPLEEILGKSGKIEIVLHYDNSSKVGELYTPFVVAMATTLPENNVHNVKVTNGKVISNGRNLIVAAVAAPGLYESLRLEELKGLDEITLSFETESFELQDIYNVVTPKILDEEDLKIFDEVDKLAGDAQKLSDSSKELVKGSRSLRDGIQDLHEAVLGAQKQLTAMESLLDDETLDQIANSAASAARKKVAGMQDEIYAQVSQNVDAMMGSLNIGFSEAEMTQLGQQIVMQTCVPQTQTAANETNDGEGGDTDVDESGEQAPAAPTIDPTCKAYVEGTLNGVAKSLPNMVSEKVAVSLPAIKRSMSESIYTQMRQTTAQTASTTARSVASQVADSIQEGLSDKLDVLMKGMLGGIDKLLDGANKLAGGMESFDTDGIQQLSSAVNGKIKNTSYKTKRLMKLAEDYNNFSGIADGAEGTTKFVLMIDGRKK